MNNVNKQMQDATFRAQLRQNPAEVLTKYGAELSADTEVKVLTNTNNTCYVVFPSSTMRYDDLSKLQAAAGTASTAGTAGSVGTAATLGSFCTTASCIGSVGSVGSVGSAGSVGAAAG